jgi:hypothetical protein
MKLDQMGDRFPAGSTPGSPKIEEDYFAFQPGKSDLSPLEGLKGEIRR